MHIGLPEAGDAGYQHAGIYNSALLSLLAHS
jgi:hypothetical protein